MLDASIETAARFVGGFIVEFLFYVVFHSIGWAMLKVLTFGKFPPPPPREYNREVVAVFPIVVAFATLTFAFS